MAGDSEHFFMCFFAIWISSFESTQERYEDRQEISPQKNKIAFDVLSAKELMQKR
jgi:hypothetical protein